MLPPLFKGSRRVMLRRLLLNGLAQAGIGLSSAWLFGMLFTAPFDATSYWYIAGLILSAIAILALRREEMIQAEHLGQDYVLQVRLKLFAKTIDAKARRQRHGIAMTRLITDLTSLKNWVSLGVARSIVATFSIVGGVLALWVWSPKLAIWASLLVATLLLTSFLLAIPLRTRVRTARSYRGRLAARIGELTLSKETLIHFGAVDSEGRRLKRISRHMADALAARMGLVGLMRALPDLLLPVAAGLFAIATWSDPTLTTSKPLVALIILGFIVQPLREILGAIDYAIAFMESRRRLQPILSSDHAPERQGNYNAFEASGCDQVKIEPDLVLDIKTEPSQEEADQPQKPNLRLVHCRSNEMSDPSENKKTVQIFAEAGAIVALRAKDILSASVLLRSLCGLRALPESYQVDIDGRPLRFFTFRERHKIFKLISRRLPLLRRSVERNLKDFSTGFNSGDREVVFRACGLVDDVELMRLKTRKLQERGMDLSASLDARLRLARAALAFPSVLLIDDHTFLRDERARVALEAIVDAFQFATMIAADINADIPSTWQAVNLDSDQSDLKCA